MTQCDTTNLTWGIWRRLWTGFVHGKRINAISEAAECLFWRLHKPADDLGNFSADPLFIKNECAPRRKWTASKIERLILELSESNLIALYEVEGDRYGHIMEFQERQPLGYDDNRNKRKPIQKFPLPPLPINNEQKRTCTKAYDDLRKLRQAEQKQKHTEIESKSRRNGTNENERSLADGELEDWLASLPPAKQTRMKHAIAKFSTLEIKSTDKQGAFEGLLSLDDPLEFINRIVRQGDGKNYTGRRLGGYVAKAIQSEVAEVAS